MTNGFFRNIRVRRVLLACSVAAIAALVLMIALIASIPALVSSPFIQTYIKQSLTKSLKRPVVWSRLTMTWSRGLTVNGLSLGDGPPPLLRGSVDEVVIEPAVSLGQNRRLKVDLTLRVRAVSTELAPGPVRPPQPYKEPLTALAESIQRFEGLDWPLPVDISVKAEIDPVRMSYGNPATGRQLTLSDCGLRLEMPSLADLPIDMQLHGVLAVDGRVLEPLRLSANVTRLVTPGRRIQPASALFALDAALPGSTLTVKGGMKEPEGFSARGRLDLQRMMIAAGPLLKPSTPALEGVIHMDLQAKMSASSNLTAALVVNGSRFAMSGGMLKKRRVGPLELQMRQKIVSDHERQQVRFADGNLSVAGLMEAGWRASVDRPDRRDRSLEAELGPLKLDLKRAMTVAGPFLPPNLPVRELEGELFVRKVLARLNGRNNQGDVVLEGLGVRVPRLRLALAKGELESEGVDLVIERGTVPLAAMKPTKIEGALSYGIRRAKLSGAQPVTAEQLRGTVRFLLNDLDLNSASPRKVAAAAELRQTLDLGRLRLGNKLSADTLHEELRLLARAGESGEIEATLPELKFSVAALQGIASGREIRPMPLVGVVTAEGIRVPSGAGAKPTLGRADCNISAGDFLQLSARAGLSAASPQIVSTGGNARLDLGRLLPIASPFLPKGVAAKGITTLSWNLNAPLVQGSLAKERNPLRLARAASALIDHGEVALSLDNRDITVPARNAKLELSSLRTTLPLRLLVPGKGGKIRLEGGVEFEGFEGLPSNLGKVPAQRGSFTVSGELAEWKTLRLKEELRVTPLGLTQVAEAAVSGLEPLLDEQGALGMATLLKHLDATLSTRVDALFPDRLTPFPGGLELSGSSSAAVTVNLAAGHELRLRAHVETRDLGARLKNGTTVEGARADFRIDRTYALAKGKVEEWTPLSAALVRPAAEQRSVAGAAEIAGRVREDLRGQESGSSRFTVRRIATRANDIPLELASIEGELLLNPEQVGLNFFQTEILGGTLRTRGVIDLRAELPTVSAACSFSNLEAALLLPPEVREKGRKENQDTEISGEMTFDAPLVAKERELLEGVRMRLNLRKIGPDTLERALFGLDPYERNEQLVAQRKMLRHGTLKRLSASTLDGALSLEGEVRVKGVDMALPRVERIRLAEMSVKKQMARTVAGISALRGVLDLVRADTLLVGPKGEISLVRK
jgi:translocation and assembly module TamB